MEEKGKQGRWGSSTMELTSFSLFPFGSKSLPPLAPPTFNEEREFFSVCE
jgi:hypothetical protein